MSNGVSEGDFDLSGAEMLDKSSADFDHTLREIDRRSPIPPLDGVKDLDDDGDVGMEGIGSNAPGLCVERSKTDLGSGVSKKYRCYGVTNEQVAKPCIELAEQCIDTERFEKRERHVGSPAGSTDIVVNAHRGEDRSGVGGVGYLGLSGNRACA